MQKRHHIAVSVKEKRRAFVFFSFCCLLLLLLEQGAPDINSHITGVCFSRCIKLVAHCDSVVVELGLKVVCCVPLLASESFAGCFQRPKTEQKKKRARSADAFCVSCAIIGPHSGSLTKAYATAEGSGLAFGYLKSKAT